MCDIHRKRFCFVCAQKSDELLGSLVFYVSACVRGISGAIWGGHYRDLKMACHLRRSANTILSGEVIVTDNDYGLEIYWHTRKYNKRLL